MGTAIDLDPAHTWSYRGGEEILAEKGLLDELPTVAKAFDEHGGGNRTLSERRNLLEPMGWEQEVSVRFEAPNTDGAVSRRTDLDAFKDGIALEHERGEQMRANWHLLKMEAAYRDPRGFADDRSVEAGVLLIPEHVSYPTLGRTRNDVQAVLANYFGFSMPLFVWQYPTTK